MKKNFSNIIFLLVLIFLVIKQAPIFIKNYNKENQKINTIQAHSLTTDNTFSFPRNEKSVLMMWATWCAPCKIEMKRVQNSIDSGTIPADRVYAMNLFEDDFRGRPRWELLVDMSSPKLCVIVFGGESLQGKRVIVFDGESIQDDLYTHHTFE